MLHTTYDWSRPEVGPHCCQLYLWVWHGPTPAWDGLPVALPSPTASYWSTHTAFTDPTTQHVLIHPHSMYQPTHTACTGQTIVYNYSIPTTCTRSPRLYWSIVMVHQHSLYWSTDSLYWTIPSICTGPPLYWSTNTVCIGPFP